MPQSSDYPEALRRLADEENDRMQEGRDLPTNADEENDRLQEGRDLLEDAIKEDL